MTITGGGVVERKLTSDEALTRIPVAESASELDNFVYLISHDIRNSARAINEVPQWIREDLDPHWHMLSPDVEENFELLERHARRLDRMLLDLLTYSRVGRKQDTSDFSLRTLLNDILDESPWPPHMQVVVNRNLPDVHMGNHDAFILVKSILENVARHCGDRPVTLDISARPETEGWSLIFTDNGPGIADSDLVRAFRPMTTLRRRDEVEGSGMGLATVHKIAVHYGGEVFAGPGPDGRGLCVTVYLRDVALKEDSK